MFTRDVANDLEGFARTNFWECKARSRYTQKTRATQLAKLRGEEMKKSTLSNSLKGKIISIIFLVIAFNVVSFGTKPEPSIKKPLLAFHVDSFGIKPEPTPSINKPFKWTPCVGNNSWFSGGLKPEFLNPAPQRWEVNDFSDLDELGNNGKLDGIDECGKASNGKWYCFFNNLARPNSGKLACVARAKIQEREDEYKHMMDPANFPTYPTPYCAAGKEVMGNSKLFSCYVYHFDESYDPNDLSKKCDGKYIKNLPDTGATYTNIPRQSCTADQSLAYCDSDSDLVEGPYRNIPDVYTACGTVYDDTNGINKGMQYQSGQKELIRSVNQAQPAHSNKLVSDLAGFCYLKPPNSECLKKHNGNRQICEEPGLGDPLDPKETLVYQPPYNQPNAAQIHHVLPRTDTRGCPCGKNSNRNAALISKQLNGIFSNMKRTDIKDLCSMKSELDFIKDKFMTPYVPSSLQPLPPDTATKKKTKNIPRRKTNKSKLLRRMG
jgi:hypothetical protein